jgi:hypothetical protein
MDRLLGWGPDHGDGMVRWFGRAGTLRHCVTKVTIHHTYGIIVLYHSHNTTRRNCGLHVEGKDSGTFSSWFFLK